VAKKKGPSKGELQQNVAAIIDNPELGVVGKPFPRRFRMLAMNGGRVCVEVGKANVVRRVGLKTEVVPAVVRYLNRSGIGGPLGAMDIDAVGAAVRYWAADTDAVAGEKVPSFLWRNEGEDLLTWHRLPFDRRTDVGPEDFPLWTEIMNRIEEEGNRSAAIMWFGSLFARESYRQQYLWLYGSGGDSKGAMIRVFKRIFGEACKASLTPPAQHGEPERWCSNLMGARLAVFPDCNSGKFPGSGLFKQVTGGDYLGSRRLYEESVEFMPECKVLFTSNTPPKISDGSANARRAIICTMEPFTGVRRQDYEEDLYREAEAFCNYGLSLYEAVCGADEIPADTSNLSTYASNFYEDLEIYSEKLIERDANWFISPAKFQEKLGSLGISASVIKELREWLLVHKGFKKRCVTTEEMERFGLKRGAKIYPGFRLVGDKDQSLTMGIRINPRKDVDG
jgi:hypothetical protein